MLLNVRSYYVLSEEEKKRTLDIYTFDEEYDDNFLESRKKRLKSNHVHKWIKETTTKKTIQPRNKLEKQEFVKDSAQSKLKRETGICLTEKLKSVNIQNFFDSLNERKRTLSIVTAEQYDLEEEEDEEENDHKFEESSVELEIFDEGNESDDSLSIELDDDLPNNPNPTPTQAPSIEEEIVPSLPVITPTMYDSDCESDSEEEETRRVQLIEVMKRNKRLKTMDWLQSDQNSQDLMNIIQKEKRITEKMAPNISNMASILDSQFDESARDSFEPELFRDCTQDSFDELRKSELSRLIPKSNTTITFASAVLYQNSLDESSSKGSSENSQIDRCKRKESIIDGLNKSN